MKIIILDLNTFQAAMWQQGMPEPVFISYSRAGVLSRQWGLGAQTIVSGFVVNTWE